MKQAADRLGVTKKKVYRAVSNGHLDATEGTYRGQTALKVSVPDLDKWAKEWLDDNPGAPPSHPESTPNQTLSHSGPTPEAPQEYVEATPVPPHDQPVPPQGYPAAPPPEVYVAMLERVARAERRAVELEFEMRKHRLLLAENAESVHEREAKIKETQAKVKETQARFDELSGVVQDKEEERDIARAEAAQAKAETELLRSKLNEITMENENLWAEKRKPWWKKMFASKNAG